MNNQNPKNSSSSPNTPLVTDKFNRSSYKIGNVDNSEFLRDRTTCIENSAVPIQDSFSEIKPEPLSEVAVQNSEFQGALDSKFTSSNISR